MTEQYTDIMIDLETMGTGPRAAIVAIGALPFNLTGERLPETYEEYDGPIFVAIVNLESCLRAGLEVDGGTIVWWLRQSEEARRAITLDPTRREPGMPLVDALSGVAKAFNQWGDKPRIWGHGASFDPVILQSAFEAKGQRCPYWFTQIRDTRTLFDIARYDWHQSGGHRAHIDAFYQSRACQEAAAGLRVVVE